jgi:hypothetical protein
MENGKAQKRTGSPKTITFPELVSDVVSITGLPRSMVREAIDFIIREITQAIFSGKAIRIQTVGVLITRKTEGGQWVGNVGNRVYKNQPLLKQRTIIHKLAQAYPRCTDPETTYHSLWMALCDVIRARLTMGYNVQIGEVGTLIPRNRRSKRYKWFISPLTQVQLMKQALLKGED